MAKFKKVQTRVNATDALVAATSVASIIAHVSDMLQFIPARAAASVVLVILRTVQEIDNNKVSVYKLARRSAKILVDLKVRMSGRWDTATKALVENISDYEKYEVTLTFLYCTLIDPLYHRVLVCIRDFMQELTKVGRFGRLLRKGSIEAALCDFHEMLDEAERTFQVSPFEPRASPPLPNFRSQIASLVEIHYTVGLLAQCGGIDVNSADTSEPSSKGGGLIGESSPLDTCDSVVKCDTACKTDATVETVERKDVEVSPPPAYTENEIASEVCDVEEVQLQEELKELERLGVIQNAILQDTY